MKYDIAVIGCGNMASAIIERARGKYNFIVSDIDQKKAQQTGVAIALDNADAVSKAKFVLLAVKPQVAADALRGIDFSGKILISIMAGASVSKLKEIARGADGVARVMPNLPARIGYSANAVYFDGLYDDEKEFVFKFLSEFGIAINVNKEEEMNIITGLSGSGPAFVFKFLRGMAKAAMECGVSEIDARRLACVTLYGSASLVMAKENESFDDLIASVCSPGGTTIEGVKHLNETHFEDIVKDAVLWSKKRAEELSS